MSDLKITGNLNVDGNNNWMGGGAVETVIQNCIIKSSNTTETVSSTQNNYVKYNSGLIIQWGHTAVSTDNRVLITFAYPFVDANYSIVVLDGDNSDWNNYMNGYRLDGTNAGQSMPLGKNSAQCQIAKRGISNNFDWIAIGRWE